MQVGDDDFKRHCRAQYIGKKEKQQQQQQLHTHTHIYYQILLGVLRQSRTINLMKTST
jgi:hypothetical protein